MEQDPYRYFRVEARELLESLGQGLLEIERGAPPAGVVPKLLRLAHTLKGAARVVRLPDIAEMAHAIEGVLAPLRDAAGPVGADTVSAILKRVDAMGSRLGALPGADRSSPPQEGPARFLAEGAAQTVRADIAEMDLLLDGIAEASVQIGSLKSAAGAAERARHLAHVLAQQLASPGAAAGRAAGIGAIPAKARSLADELCQVVAGLERGVLGSLERIDGEMRQVRDKAERLRLLPASVLFAPLERAARDAAQALGKSAGFEANGGDVRLDAHILAGVQGALVQAVRNAVAHGIETETERSAAGKPPQGKVTLAVARRGRRVAFECRDDGRGVDVEAVRRVAQAKGLLAPAGPTPALHDLLRLLLEGGLTTSGSLSEVSGRGIGLDVVREAMARLGGDVSLRTEPGRGSTLEMIVPVSLASLDVLLVDCSGAPAAIPLDAVSGTLRLRAEEIQRVPQGATVLHDGTAVPFLPLGRHLGRPAGNGHRPAAWSGIVVRRKNGIVVLGADRLLGTMTVVLRPLPALAPVDPVVAGLWLDAEGNPQVLIDPDGLQAAAVFPEGATDEPGAARGAPVLVVDDSLTTRMLEQSILESAGYDVDLAVSGEEGLEKARRRRYGMFVVDVEMPGMDGFTFVERTRADPALCGVPAILVTSRNSAEDRQRGKAAGAGAYICKGEFDQAHLLETIRRLSG
jgi:two-component system chemotaxis sensor kinase CheA